MCTTLEWLFLSAHPKHYFPSTPTYNTTQVTEALQTINVIRAIADVAYADGSVQASCSDVQVCTDDRTSFVFFIFGTHPSYALSHFSYWT